MALVDASLLVAETTPMGGGYRLLEPVRQFARDQLERNQEERKARTEFLKACLSWVTRLVEARVPQNRLIAQLGREYPNLESSLDWGLQAPGMGVESLSLAHELYNFWLWNGPFDKGANYLERAIQKGKRLDEVEPGVLYNQLGLLAGYAGDYVKSEAAFTKAIDLFKKAGLSRRMAAAYCNFALHVRNSGDYERAIALGKKSIEFSDDEDPNLLKLLGNHATDLAEAGFHEEARIHLTRAMALNETIGDPLFIATHRSTLAYLDFVENNTEKGEQNLNMSLAYYRLVGDVQGLLSTIEFAARLALRFGKYERAAKLFGGTAAHFLKAGVGRNIPDVARRDEALTTIESMLGKEESEALYAFGALLTLDELYDFARSGPDSDSDPLGL